MHLFLLHSEALVKRRAAIAREILSTEKSYVTSLDTLVKVRIFGIFDYFQGLLVEQALSAAFHVDFQVYKMPLVESLQSGKPLISKEDVDKIFSNIEGTLAFPRCISFWFSYWQFLRRNCDCEQKASYSAG